MQYSGTMTVKDLPNELRKIKGREPLSQKYPNHVNNMASNTQGFSSFKSKSKVSYPSSSSFYFRLLSLEAVCLVIITGLLREIFVVLLEI